MKEDVIGWPVHYERRLNMDNEKKIPTEEVKAKNQDAKDNKAEKAEPSYPSRRYGDAEHDPVAHSKIKPQQRSYKDRWHYPGG